MTMNQVIQDWCDEQNKKTNKIVWLYSFTCVAIIAGAGAYVPAYVAMLLLTVLTVAITVWVVIVPKQLSKKALRCTLRDCRVDDGLLAKINKSTEVPDLVKHRIAQTLKTEGRITYAVLFNFEQKARTAEVATIQVGV